MFVVGNLISFYNFVNDSYGDLSFLSFKNLNYEIQGPPWKLAIFVAILYDICPNLANINSNKVMFKTMKLCNMVR
jgi:hypothetical protein